MHWYLQFVLLRQNGRARFHETQRSIEPRQLLAHIDRVEAQRRTSVGPAYSFDCINQQLSKASFLPIRIYGQQTEVTVLATECDENCCGQTAWFLVIDHEKKAVWPGEACAQAFLIDARAVDEELFHGIRAINDMQQRVQIRDRRAAGCR